MNSGIIQDLKDFCSTFRGEIVGGQKVSGKLRRGTHPGFIYTGRMGLSDVLTCLAIQAGQNITALVI